MRRPTATPDDNAPGFRPEAPSDPTAGLESKSSETPSPSNAPRQSTLADVTGEPLPAAYFPNPTTAEEAAREQVADLMRRYAIAHPCRPFDVYDALPAGWDLPDGCRGNAVMGPGVHLAAMRGWIRYAGHDRKGHAPRTHAGRLRTWIGGAP